MSALPRPRGGRVGAPVPGFGLAFALAAGGCASLHAEEGDTTGDRVAKGAGRATAAILTLGLTEVWHENEATMEAWLGHTARDLLRSWGTPQEIVRVSGGERVYVYIDQEITPPEAGMERVEVLRVPAATVDGSEAPRRPRGANARTPPYAREWGVFRQFHIDGRGIIVDYAWEGL